MAIVESKLKNGVLKMGPSTGTQFDFSCQVVNARINSTYSDDGDPLETLCGDTVPAGRKLDGRALAGTFVQDWEGAASVVDYVWDHDLETMKFTYTPSASAPTLSGSIRLEVPSETYGGDVNARITSDFEWSIIGATTRGALPVHATGATAGVPGTWTPALSVAPATVQALQNGIPNVVTASPATAWTTGQYVQTLTAGVPGQAHWNGTAWIAGPKP